jgi:hypothetical protein
MNEQDQGFVIGFFCEQGNFGGDGKQPHLILRMGKEKLFVLNKLSELLEGSKINGPYVTNRREYYQWSLRGDGLEQLVSSKLLEKFCDYDPSAYARYRLMVDRYFDSSDKPRFRSLKRRRMTSSRGGSSTETV